MNAHLSNLVLLSLIVLPFRGYFSYEELCDEVLCNSLQGKCLTGTINATTGKCVCLGVLNCSLMITDCSCSVTNNPCYNGVCLDSEDGSGYWCNCTEGWSGAFCEVDNDYCPSSETYCGHGVCIEGVGTDYYCKCDEVYRGITCNELFCPEDYCSNNGSCSLLTNEQNETHVHCQCLYGYYGSRCENKVARCDQAQCSSLKGNCIDDETGECICLGVFNCSTTIPYCQFNDGIYGICYNGTCQNESTNGYECICAEGFKGSNCEIDVEYCSSINCGNGTCVDGIGDDFHCLCDETYQGKICNKPYCPEGYCLNGGTCTTENNVTECKCPIGYTGKKCGDDLPVCTPNICGKNKTCIEGPGLNYTCVCPSDMVDCDGDPCEPNPCMNNGTCTKFSDTKFKCKCVPGIGGDYCEKDVLDYCAVFNPCLNGGSCVDRSGEEYECVCPPGYSGKNCTNDEEYCNLIKPSMCSQCNESSGNSVSCGDCPQICECSVCSCRPNYCDKMQLIDIDIPVENVTCLYSLKSNINLIEDSVIISCLCQWHPSFSISSFKSPAMSTVSSDAVLYPSTSPSDVDPSSEYQLKMLSSLKDSATLNEHSNDSTFDSDYSILIGILVPGIFLISCLLIIIAFLIIAIVRMLNRTSNRVMPSLNSKCSF